MRQAHAEGVATAASAILAIEKDNRAFGDDDHDDDHGHDSGDGDGEMQVSSALVLQFSVAKIVKVV